MSTTEQPKRGFAVGDNAVKAARKLHDVFKTAHRWTSRTGAEAGRKSAQVRWGQRVVPVTQHCPSE